MSTDISIVIVSWNSREYLAGCVSSLAAGAGRCSFETFVVDNGSDDGSADAVRELFPGVTLIANSVNRGFAAANNQALARARGRYAFLLNPDTVAKPRALEIAVEFMDSHPEAGICGCLLLDENGAVQHTARRFPTFRSALGSKTILGRLGLFRGSHRAVRMAGVRYDERMEVDQPSGAALCVRRSVLDEVGLLDEGYFIFFEEVDLCRRVKDAGYRIFILPDAQITHYGGRSRRRNRRAVMLNSASSLLRYLRKHRGRFRSIIFEFAFRPLFALDLLLDAVSSAARAALLPADAPERAARRERMAAYFEFVRRDLVKFMLAVGE